MQYPEHLLDFSKKIMDHFLNISIDTVISPAVGGIVIGTEVGRIMNKKTIFYRTSASFKVESNMSF